MESAREKTLADYVAIAISPVLIMALVGSLVLTLLSDAVTELLAALGWELPGTKQVLYGLALLGVVMFLPQGIWPALHRRLRLQRWGLPA